MRRRGGDSGELALLAGLLAPLCCHAIGRVAAAAAAHGACGGHRVVFVAHAVGLQEVQQQGQQG
eukprot:CAMPEP_0202390912 /NCGR_PEP_ID=MMETSP1127-20130417/91197_1 /ASSEMBLY_ACC=CAM_ASM_000462 /TAXON_ID=3047 /ORGANISM="Dunaliella tertiolecta, Strain CCMP1320" /LENGTH=63 /DNA_ID=CAMNT_0048993283 /DNA_START=62 /DNA_END=249 /DNA_ORIENTATION=+